MRGLAFVLLSLLLCVDAVAAPPLPPQPPTATFPPNSVTLPTNARLVFSGLADLQDVSFVRPGVDGELTFEVIPRVNDVRVLFVVDPGDLTGVDTLVIEPRCSGCFVGAQELPSWAVGDDVDDDAPVFAPGDGTVTQVSTAGTVDAFGFSTPISEDVRATLPVVTDASGFVLVRTETDDDAFLDDEAIASGTAPDVAASFAPGPVRNECFRAFALDVAFNETALANPICADVGDDGGCAQTSAASTSSLAALFACLCALRFRTRGRGSR